MWDKGWDDLFARKAWGKYPPEEVVRFVARNYLASPHRKSVRILEVGCGPGANLWLLAREGVSAYGLDGSSVAVLQARERLESEGLTAEIRVGDAAQIPWSEEFFDAVLDIECIYANSLVDARRIIQECYRVMKPGGLFFSKCFATGTTGEGSGTRVGKEAHTWRDLNEGPFNRGYGIIRFTDETEIPDLYAGLESLSWDYIQRSDRGGRVISKEWLISGRKPLSQVV
jgi:SAM-dependent methyltransferase